VSGDVRTRTQYCGTRTCFRCAGHRRFTEFIESMSNNEPEYEYRLTPEYEYGPVFLAPFRGLPHTTGYASGCSLEASSLFDRRLCHLEGMDHETLFAGTIASTMLSRDGKTTSQKAGGEFPALALRLIWQEIPGHAMLRGRIWRQRGLPRRRLPIQIADERHARTRQSCRCARSACGMFATLGIVIAHRKDHQGENSP